MNASAASTPAVTAFATSSNWLRRLALRATVLTFVLATSFVGFAGVAWASPEMGC